MNLGQMRNQKGPWNPVSYIAMFGLATKIILSDLKFGLSCSVYLMLRLSEKFLLVITGLVAFDSSTSPKIA